MKYFAGLDVSLQETAICVVDEDGIIVTEGKAASAPDDLVRWLATTGWRSRASGSRSAHYPRGCTQDCERRDCRRSVSRPGG